jgi:hypothetical protein
VIKIERPTDEFRPTPAFNARRREREWLELNGARYAGQWVVIEGDKLVSHGENAEAVLQQARAEGILHDDRLVSLPSRGDSLF